MSRGEKNEVFVSGMVKVVVEKEYSNFRFASVKLVGKTGSELWVKVMLDADEKCRVSEGDGVVIFGGTLSSWTKDGKTRFQLESRLNSIAKTGNDQVPVNHAFVKGKVIEERDGWARLANSYYKPTKKEWGERHIRIKLPNGTKALAGSKVMVIGHLSVDDAGVHVLAKSIIEVASKDEPEA